MEDEDLVEVVRVEGYVINEELFYDAGLWRIKNCRKWEEWRVT